MRRHHLRELCVFVLACGVYFGAMPHMYLVRVRATGAEALASFVTEATVAWVVLAAVYVYWRQLTPLAVHCVCVPLSLVLMIGNPDVIVESRLFALVPVGLACWAAMLISFPVSLLVRSLSAVVGRRIEPLAERLGRGYFAGVVGD